MTLNAQIEAILFFKGEPVSARELSRMLKVSESEIADALPLLEGHLNERGLKLVYKEDEVMLATAPEAGNLIEEIVKEELSRDLGKAGLETLSIVLYHGPVTRADIDYIRGVNSTFVLRNLLVRGLVEKVHNPNDQRSFLYKPTFQLLSFLGIPRVEDLPEYDASKRSVKDFFDSQEETEVAVNNNEENIHGGE